MRPVRIELTSVSLRTQFLPILSGHMLTQLDNRIQYYTGTIAARLTCVTGGNRLVVEYSLFGLLHHC
jgi:hypothetical protein